MPLMQLIVNKNPSVEYKCIEHSRLGNNKFALKLDHYDDLMREDAIISKYHRERGNFKHMLIVEEVKPFSIIVRLGEDCKESLDLFQKENVFYQIAKWRPAENVNEEE